MAGNSKGVVLFAYNSGYDYVSMANAAACLAKKNLGLPVTLITDVFGALKADLDYIDTIIEFDAVGFNNRTFRGTHDEGTKKIEWKNLSRAHVYELSPYDQTLLIDCDFMILGQHLLKLFDANPEFTCHSNVHDITDMDIFCADNRLQPYGIPMCWATVIYFQKCEFSKAIFDMMLYVKENYSYYAQTFGFNEYPYRNDYALSIAHHVLTGYGTESAPFLPYSLLTLASMTDVIKFANGSMHYQYYNSKRQLCSAITSHSDIHIMNKDIFTKKLLQDILAYGKN